MKKVKKPSAPLLSIKELWLARLCFSGLILLSFLMSFHTLTDTDIFWHLKTGEIIYQTHRVPAQDLYSFTRAGKEWIDSQWLFQLIIYTLYRFSGYTGMILFGALVSALTWLLILAPAFNSQRALLLSLFSLLSLLTASIRFKLRPELLSFFYLVLELILIEHIKRGKRWQIFLMPILLLLWQNSEGLWPIYFVVLTAFLGEELLWIPSWGLRKFFQRDGPSTPSQFAFWLGMILVCSIPLTLVNPYGIRGVLFPWVLFKEVAHPGSYLGKVIYEFRNPFFHLPWLELSAYLILLIISGLLFAFLFHQRRIYLAPALLWICFLFLSLSALRNVALFAIITITLVNRILAKSQAQEWFPGLENRLRKFRLGASMIVLAFVLWLMIDVISGRFFLRNRTYVQFGIGALETEYPIRACRTLRQISEKLGETLVLKIFSDASSGYLIWAGYPSWKVYIDPRLELYGEEFFKNYLRALENWQKFQEEDKIWDFDGVVLDLFLSPSALFLNLYQDSGWSLMHLDGRSALFLKNKLEFAPALEQFRIDFQKGYKSPEVTGVKPALVVREKLNLGKVLLLIEQFDLAREVFEEGIKLKPENLELNFFLGSTLNLLGRYPEALSYLEKVVAKEPELAQNQIQLARALAGTRNYHSAVQIFQKLLAQDPNQIYVCMDLAKVYEMMNASSQAYHQWQRCFEIYAQNPQKFRQEAEEISQALRRLEKTP